MRPLFYFNKTGQVGQLPGIILGIMGLIIVFGLAFSILGGLNNSMLTNSSSGAVLPDAGLDSLFSTLESIIPSDGLDISLGNRLVIGGIILVIISMFLRLVIGSGGYEDYSFEDYMKEEDDDSDSDSHSRTRVPTYYPSSKSGDATNEDKYDNEFEDEIGVEEK